MNAPPWSYLFESYNLLSPATRDRLKTIRREANNYISKTYGKASTNTNVASRITMFFRDHHYFGIRGVKQLIIREVLHMGITKAAATIRDDDDSIDDLYDGMIEYYYHLYGDGFPEYREFLRVIEKTAKKVADSIGKVKPRKGNILPDTLEALEESDAERRRLFADYTNTQDKHTLNRLLAVMLRDISSMDKQLLAAINREAPRGHKWKITTSNKHVGPGEYIFLATHFILTGSIVRERTESFGLLLYYFIDGSKSYAWYPNTATDGPSANKAISTIGGILEKQGFRMDDDV